MHTYYLIIPPATKLGGGYTGISLSVCLSVRLSVCLQTQICTSYSSQVYAWILMKLCTHVIHDMILCLPERHYVLLFFSRVMALDISKWKIVHVHYSLSLKWLVFCINIYFRILQSLILFTPLMTFRCVRVKVKDALHY